MAPPLGLKRLLLGVVLSGVTACGSAATTPASPTPDVAARGDALLRSSAAALAAAPGYHARGMVAAGYGIDMRVVHGEGAAGLATYHGLTWEVVATAHDVYFRGRALWNATQPPADAATLGDQWVRMTGVVGFYGWLELLPRLAGVIEQGIFVHHGPVAAIADGTYGGHAVTHLSGPQDTYEITRDTSAPLPLRWTDLKEPAVNGIACGLDIDGIGTQAAVTAPADAVPYTGVPDVAGTTPPPVG